MFFLPDRAQGQSAFQASHVSRQKSIWASPSRHFEDGCMQRSLDYKLSSPVHATDELQPNCCQYTAKLQSNCSQSGLFGSHGCHGAATPRTGGAKGRLGLSDSTGLIHDAIGRMLTPHPSPLSSLRLQWNGIRDKFLAGLAIVDASKLKVNSGFLKRLSIETFNRDFQ